MRPSREFGAKRRCPAALPHNRWGHRLVRLPFPNNGCLALIGNPEPADRSRPALGLLQHTPRRLHLCAPDCLRVLLYPTGLRIAALDRRRIHRQSSPLLVINRCPRACGSFVQRQEKWHSGIIVGACSFAAKNPMSRLSPNASPASKRSTSRAELSTRSALRSRATESAPSSRTTLACGRTSTKQASRLVTRSASLSIAVIRCSGALHPENNCRRSHPSLRRSTILKRT